MALVDYSSSDDNSDNGAVLEDGSLQTASSSVASETRKRKRKRNSSTSEMPALPASFHDLYASTTRLSTRDDPNFHGGRKRVAPHIEGNWPSHIYIEWYPMKAEHEILASLISCVKENPTTSSRELKVMSLLSSDLDAPLPLHISLSRPIGFTAEQKDLFTNSLQESIACSNIRPFEVSFEDLDWTSNYEKTRRFLVLRIKKPQQNELNRLLNLCNEIVQDFSQPPLYASRRSTGFPSNNDGKSMKSRPNKEPVQRRETETQDYSSAFHISIGWSLEEPIADKTDWTRVIMNSEVLKTLKATCVKIDAVKVKVGNIVTSIALPMRAPEGNGLFELR